MTLTEFLLPRIAEGVEQRRLHRRLLWEQDRSPADPPRPHRPRGRRGLARRGHARHDRPAVLEPDPLGLDPVQPIGLKHQQGGVALGSAIELGQ